MLSADLIEAIADAKRHSVRRIAATPVRTAPFPHIVVDEIFPPAFYGEIQRRLLPDSAYRVLAETGRVSPKYNPARYCLFPNDLDADHSSGDSANRAFWKALFTAYCDAEFITLWLGLFKQAIEERFAAGHIPDHIKNEDFRADGEIFLMRDLATYQLLPHTDSPAKIVSALFYLPPDDSLAGLGTSLYVPKEANYSNPGGPHLPRDRFDLVQTLPYHANTLVAFPKSSVCFHGVEPVTEPHQRRDLMLFDIKFGGPSGG